MSKKALRPQKRIHVILYEEDIDWLTQNYGPGSRGSGVGFSGAVRHIVHQRVQGMKAKINGELDKLRDIQKGEASGLIQPEE